MYISFEYSVESFGLSNRRFKSVGAYRRHKLEAQHCFWLFQYLWRQTTETKTVRRLNHESDSTFLDTSKTKMRYRHFRLIIFSINLSQATQRT